MKLFKNLILYTAFILFAIPLNGKIISNTLPSETVAHLDSVQRSSIDFYIHKGPINKVGQFSANIIDSLNNKRRKHIVVIIINSKKRQLHVQLSEPVSRYISNEQVKAIQEKSKWNFAKKQYLAGLELIIKSIEDEVFISEINVKKEKKDNRFNIAFVLSIFLIIFMYFLVNWLFFSYDIQTLNNFKLQVSDLASKFNSYQNDTILQWQTIIGRKYRLQNFKWKKKLPVHIHYLNTLNQTLQALMIEDKYEYKEHMYKNYVVPLFTKSKTVEKLENELTLFNAAELLEVKLEWIKSRNAQILTQLELLSKEWKVKSFINDIKKENNEKIKYEELKNLTNSNSEISEHLLEKKFEKTYSKRRSEMNDLIEQLGHKLRELGWPDTMVKEYCKIQKSPSNKEEVAEKIEELKQTLQLKLPHFSVVDQKSLNHTIEEHIKNLKLNS